MPRHLIELLPETSFLRKFSMLAGGTLVGQALVILSSPLLTRLFTPEEFGFFAVFAGIAGIAGVLAGLRYEFAIPVMTTDSDAAALTIVTALVTLVTALGLAGLIWAWGDRLAEAVSAPALGLWLWLLPPAVLVWGLGSALTYWSVRRRTYAINAVNRTLQLGSQAAGQVLLGLLGSGGPGLVIGYLVGYAVRLGHFLHRLPAADLRLMVAQPPRILWQKAHANWRYPAFGFPSSTLQAICQHAPAILLAALFGGPVIAGLYALSQRIMGLPVKLLSEAASKVFLGEARGLDGASLRQHFLRTMLLFTGIGLLGLLPVILFGPALFAWVFGANWYDAGVIAQLLAPLYLSRFVVQPLSHTLYIINRQDIVFFSAIMNTCALFGAFSMGKLLTLSSYTTIFLFSILSALSFLFNLAMAWYFVRQGGVAAPNRG